MDCMEMTLGVADILVTFFVGLAAAAIAWMQFRLGHHTLKAELFEKRYIVFNGARKFLSAIMRDGNCSHDAVVEYIISTADAEFLFDEEMVDYLANLKDRGLQLASATRDFQDTSVSELKTLKAGKANELLTELNEELTLLRGKFSRDLNVNKFSIL